MKSNSPDPIAGYESLGHFRLEGPGLLLAIEAATERLPVRPRVRGFPRPFIAAKSSFRHQLTADRLGLEKYVSEWLGLALDHLESSDPDRKFGASLCIDRFWLEIGLERRNFDGSYNSLKGIAVRRTEDDEYDVYGSSMRALRRIPRIIRYWRTGER